MLRLISRWRWAAGAACPARLAALGIGAFETFISAGPGDAWASAALYISVLVVLAVRPQGLFGEPLGRRA
jgi:branched-chain amino acid transport system permease protein